MYRWALVGTGPAWIGHGEGFLRDSSADPDMAFLIEAWGSQNQGCTTEIGTTEVGPPKVSACQEGKQPERAVEILESMQQQGVVPEVITYSALISA